MSTCYVLEACPGHFQFGHPEHPDRLLHVQDVLAGVDARKVESGPASLDEIGLVHTAAFVRDLQEQCTFGDAIIDPAPTFVTRASFDAARKAAGATLACTRAMLRGEASNAFSIVRPPGHHAEPDRAMGFCLFNNAAIAAAWALTQGLERVAIVDYDAHHGNGTQAAFLHDPRVAYLSTHQWGIYPGTGGAEDAPGARGRIVNVPMPARAGDGAFARIADGIVERWIRGFSPQMIVVSAGFDAHWDDPLTSLGLSSAGFHRLSRTLVELANEHCGGRILFVLEGGYEPVNVANGTRAVFAALTNAPLPDLDDASPYPEPDVSRQLAQMRALHGLDVP